MDRTHREAEYRVTSFHFLRRRRLPCAAWVHEGGAMHQLLDPAFPPNRVFDIEEASSLSHVGQPPRNGKVTPGRPDLRCRDTG